MNWHDVDFKVPLSGSKLFDLSNYAIAFKICQDFPGLEFTYDHNHDNEIHIFGKLNDMWYEEFQRTLYSSIGREFKND